jgi:hypothetical protein
MKSDTSSGIEPPSDFQSMWLNLICHGKRKPIKKLNLPSLPAGLRTTFQEFAPPD